jgi:hypothetical protein
MNVRTCRWIVALVFLALVVPAFADDNKSATLKWKFEKDKTFYQEMKTETQQTMKVQGSDVVQKQDMTFYFSWTPKSNEGDTWVIEQKIIGVVMKIDIGGTKVEYDSRKDNPAGNPLGDFFNKLKDSEFKITLNTKENKVTKVEGRDAFVNKLIGANPQMEKLLKQILTDDALKEMAEPTFAAVPAMAVTKGKSWDRSAKIEMGPLGRYDNNYKYTYEGTGQDKLDTIKIDVTTKYVPPPDTAMNVGEGTLPFKIKKGDLKSSSSSGTVKFDNAKGRVESTDTTLEIKGDLDIEISGQVTKVELTQKQTTSVKTLDKNPVEKPAGTEKPKQ